MAANHQDDISESRYDVVVVGGGMIGLSLACAAARVGLDVAVIERVAFESLNSSSFDGRASAIALGSQRMLAAIGVWKYMVSSAQPILDIRVSDRESLLHLHFDHNELDGVAFGYMVENGKIRDALLEAANQYSNLDIIAPHTVVAIERSVGNAAVTLDNRRVVKAPLIVACDGRRSPLRAMVGIRAPGWTYPQNAIVCTIEHQFSHGGIAHEKFLSGGPFAVLPLLGKRASLVWTEEANLAEELYALDDKNFDIEVNKRLGSFLGDAHTIGARYHYPLAMHHAEQYVDHRIALVGDAAHGVHPIAGQGLNMGLRDVAALTEVLVNNIRLGLDHGTMEVLQHYERWRRIDNLSMVAVTDALNRLFVAEGTMIKISRKVGLAAVNRLPPLKRFFMRHARGTGGSLPRLLDGEVP